MVFILGFIAGIATIGIIVVFDIYLFIHKASFTERAIAAGRSRASPRAQIISPSTPAQEALDRLANNPEEINLHNL